MYIPTEIIIFFFLVSFLIYTMPFVLVKFSRTLRGKLLLLLLTVVLTLYNRTAGLLMAMLVIFLAEFNYELNDEILYEGMAVMAEKKAKEEQLTIEELLKAVNSRT